MEGENVLASGKKWSREAVCRDLILCGVSPEAVYDLCFRVENAFALEAGRKGAFLEWSLRHAEVSGGVESLQFDIDRMREEAIEAISEDWLAENP